ncbi:hypothetical protein Q5P01_018629 [Channa striata]|uniref:G2/mitotic-specific cyclin-B2 n=1 Tax=Channa striata TaxID=64152 RepID=A0AA88M882_CHASR|nr:hypothetical protein Q5P01_018629 [Channa striata]
METVILHGTNTGTGTRLTAAARIPGSFLRGTTGNTERSRVGASGKLKLSASETTTSESTTMTRDGHCQQKRSENAAGEKGTVTPVQPLSKLQCEKSQLVHKGVTKTGLLMETPEKELGTWEPSYSFLTSKDSLVHLAPPPLIGWGFAEDVRTEVVRRKQNCRCRTNFMQNHPRIHPRMRSVLLDWLIEVSEAYTLHRQTFYLALDYFDRFMLSQKSIEKGVLQLIGITCLFIASKMEEGSPLKVSEMADVTAGTFCEDEILKMELIILKALGWNLYSETAVSWLKLFFQMASKTSGDLLEPQFPQDTYVQMTRLLDLCILNINSLDFHYHVLAASVCFHFLDQEKVEKASGLSKDAIQPCVSWMASFAESMLRFNQATERDFTQIEREDRHNIQTHAQYMTMLDDVSQTEAKFPTPPNSTEENCTHAE